jgi:hypothetical protein
VGGDEDDAMETLSGRLAGRLVLDAAIVNRTVNPWKELTRIRNSEKLCDEILRALDEVRDRVVLQGYTLASPDKPVRIPRELPLD